MARVGAMDEKARRRAVTAMLDKLRADMLAAINKMPDDWETEEIGWYLVRSAKRGRLMSIGGGALPMSARLGAGGSKSR